ncbi:MAG: transglutaminase domain-containing protein [Deltaproteobacteria bacterium]|nr:transglutaminase domain-containing protein [Deltaproteobacteria bacterium]
MWMKISSPRLWKSAVRIVLLTGAISLAASWVCRNYFEVPLLQAGKLLLRAGVLKTLEVTTSFYDPYVSASYSRLYPKDWAGWPPNASLPHATINVLRNLTGESVYLSDSTTYPVEDRALTFAYELSQVKELYELRSLYLLKNKSEQPASQLDQLAELNDWTRQHWIHGSNRPVNFFRFNAVEILEQAKRGGQYWCQVASMTFVQVATSLGYQARLLSLYETPTREPEHAVAEVWVDELGKWVVFDTDFNLYYRNQLGVPMNALELHEALVTGNVDSIQVVKGAYRPEHYDIEGALAQPLLLPYYRHFCIEMRNDWLSHPYFPGHPKRSDKNSLCWSDGKGFGPFNLRPIARSPSDIYWPLNHVDIRLAMDVSGRDPMNLAVYFRTITPNFDRFEISLQGAPEFFHQSTFLRWQLKRGENRLQIRAVNAFGKKGPPSRLTIVWTHT